MTSIKENHGVRVAVTNTYYWEPIGTAPIGCKLQLKTIHGVATYGEVNEKNRGAFIQWAPMPATRKLPKEQA